MSRTPDAFDDESPAPVVRFEGVRATAGQDPAAPEISFTVRAGGLYLLAGPAGAGKSAVLDLIGLNARHARGKIALFDRDVTRLRPREVPFMRRRIGRVFQDLRLDDDLTVFDNVAMAVRATGRPAEDSRHQIAEVLAWLGLGTQMGKRPKRLCVIDQRRLAIARALINRPTLVIADEPTGEIDGSAAAALLRPLIDVNRVGTTVLIASRRTELLADAGATVIALAPPPAPPRPDVVQGTAS